MNDLMTLDGQSSHVHRRPQVASQEAFGRTLHKVKQSSHGQSFLGQASIKVWTSEACPFAASVAFHFFWRHKSFAA